MGVDRKSRGNILAFKNSSPPAFPNQKQKANQVDRVKSNELEMRCLQRHTKPILTHAWERDGIVSLRLPQVIPNLCNQANQLPAGTSGKVLCHHAAHEPTKHLLAILEAGPLLRQSITLNRSKLSKAKRFQCPRYE